MFDVIVFGNTFVAQQRDVIADMTAAVAQASATPFTTDAEAIAAAAHTLRQLGWRVAMRPDTSARRCERACLHSDEGSAA